MNAHTPGPWFIWQELAMRREGCDPDEIADTLQYNSQHSIYAGNPKECTRGWLKGCITHICDIEADGLDFDEDEDEDDCRATALANARLIAAAPELLEALEEITAELGVCGLTEKARAAITKATGE